MVSAAPLAHGRGLVGAVLFAGFVLLLITVPYLGSSAAGTAAGATGCDGGVAWWTMVGLDREVRTRVPSLQLERTHPDPELIALGEFLAGPERAGRPGYERLFGLADPDHVPEFGRGGTSSKPATRSSPSSATR